MKKTTILTLAVSIIFILSCKKKEDTPAPVATTTTTGGTTSSSTSGSTTSSTSGSTTSSTTSGSTSTTSGSTTSSTSGSTTSTTTKVSASGSFTLGTTNYTVNYGDDYEFRNSSGKRLYFGYGTDLNYGVYFTNTSLSLNFTDLPVSKTYDISSSSEIRFAVFESSVSSGSTVIYYPVSGTVTMVVNSTQATITLKDVLVKKSNTGDPIAITGTNLIFKFK